MSDFPDGPEKDEAGFDAAAIIGKSMATLPEFRYHPDPLRSGSIEASDAVCRCCNQARGYVYSGPVYAEHDLDAALCPWCIAEGKAARRFDASFVDSEAFTGEVPAPVMDEVCSRTPGYAGWQQEQWPVCCGDAAAFLRPAGIDDIRREQYQLEGAIMGHIVHDMQISGGAATRLLDSLRKDQSPTLYVFECLHCQTYHFHIDGL
jgi:uncharacterized protein